MSDSLRYSISSWMQATECLSNNSRQLVITVSSLSGNSLHGQLIAVKHPAYGVLFSAMTEGSGELVTTETEEGVVIPWMTTDEILTQLKKFGFDIVFDRKKHLPGDQITYLMTLYNLGFQHLTTIKVNSGKTSRDCVIAFNGTEEPEWLDWPCATTKGILDKKVTDGKVLNVSALAAREEFNWDWLDFVANITDILAENAQQ